MQTGKSVRQDLTSVVTASGEIKPRNYINIGSNAHRSGHESRTSWWSKARKSVKRARWLPSLEAVQADAEVAAQRAAVGSTEAESRRERGKFKRLNIRPRRSRPRKASWNGPKPTLIARVSISNAPKIYSTQKLIARQEFVHPTERIPQC